MTRKVTLSVNGIQVASGTVPQEWLDNPYLDIKIRLDPDALAVEQGTLRSSTVLLVDLPKVS